MELDHELKGDVLVITPADTRIDAAVAIQFKDRMRELCSAAGSRIVLDLGQVDFVDSSGLGAIVAAMKQIGASARLELASLTPNVAKVFRLTRMDTVFSIHDDLDSALQPKAAHG
ncbi:STAS domain-containing protein [Meridianimarinicoccus aquatilis]|uniref:Anti-sigma factor antagonist n=1 Tax=Meridianimarinicoccus aquatilis TaxID=2552766 RepID=A0A4R6AT54_9RHOB|nr:STAS domain-containing protein [Fluviibacterium aquatile]QIE41122.1 STAS domain-containing protein [Rhodobacteraceae bacterium SC52]TDL85033.1 anti-sigma factor antagonist [Fluviibacterium aquatile]